MDYPRCPSTTKVMPAGEGDVVDPGAAACGAPALVAAGPIAKPKATPTQKLTTNATGERTKATGKGKPSSAVGRVGIEHEASRKQFLVRSGEKVQSKQFKYGGVVSMRTARDKADAFLRKRDPL